MQRETPTYVQPDTAFINLESITNVLTTGRMMVGSGVDGDELSGRPSRSQNNFEQHLARFGEFFPLV